MMSRRWKGWLILLPFVVLLAALVVAVAPVVGIPPDREPIPVEEPFVISGACDFDVLTEDLLQKEQIATFYDQEGNARLTLITGALKVRLTNLSSGESMVLNISGPGRFEPQAAGRQRITAMGPWLWWGVPGVPELQSLVLTRGRLDVLFDGATVEVLSMNGQLVDLCPVLADL